MIVTYEPPGLNRVGLLHAPTLTREEGPNADAGSFRAAHGNPICATS
jgi:hypothetical protein